MAVNEEEIHNILVAVLSGDEQEIYNALCKKKEIIDKSPNLRTVDEKNMLQSLSKKIRKQVWGALRANSKFGLCYTPWYVVCGMVCYGMYGSLPYTVQCIPPFEMYVCYDMAGVVVYSVFYGVLHNV